MVVDLLNVGSIRVLSMNQQYFYYSLNTETLTLSCYVIELLFNRQNRDKIPALEGINRTDDSEVRDRDKTLEDRGKIYSDRKRQAVESEISEGDKVYAKTMVKANKLASNFNPTPHTVESSRNGDCTIKNYETDQRYRRNVVHLKRVEGEWKTVTEEKEPEAIENSREQNGEE